MLPKAEIKRFDQDIRDRFDALASRQSELAVQLVAIDGEQEQILTSLGKLVADGAKYKKHTDRLAVLRLESEALHAGILYLKNQVGLLRRFNTWLPT